FIVDAVAPTTLANVTNGSFSNHPITLSASDDNSGVASTHYTVDGGADTTYSGSFTVADGSHTLTYWSVDNAGNVEPIHTVTFTQDTVTPVTSLTTSPAAPDGLNGWFLGPVTVTLSVADATGSTTKYSVDGGPTQTYSGPFVISTQGVHTV